MNVIMAGDMLIAIVCGMFVFIKFRREIKYEVRDNSLEIKRKKLEYLYQSYCNLRQQSCN